VCCVGVVLFSSCLVVCCSCCVFVCVTCFSCYRCEEDADDADWDWLFTLEYHPVHTIHTGVPPIHRCEGDADDADWDRPHAELHAAARLGDANACAALLAAGLAPDVTDEEVYMYMYIYYTYIHIHIYIYIYIYIYI